MSGHCVRHSRAGSLRFSGTAVTGHVERDVVEHYERGPGQVAGAHRVAADPEDAGHYGGVPHERVAALAEGAARERAALHSRLLDTGAQVHGRIEDLHGYAAAGDGDGASSTVRRRTVIVTTVREGVRRSAAVTGTPGDPALAEVPVLGQPLPEHRGPLPRRILLRPLALAELLAEYASVGLAVQEPRAAGAFHERWYGRRVAAPGVDLTDDPGLLGGWTLDSEGTPAEPLPLVRDGLVTGYGTDRRAAHALGSAPNGRASHSVDGLSCYPSALVLDCPPADTDAEAGTWLDVECVQYISVVDADTGTVTGSTRDLCTINRDGVPVATVPTVRFTVTVPDLLTRITGAVGPPLTVPVTWGGCAVRAPAVHLDGVDLLP